MGTTTDLRTTASASAARSASGWAGECQGTGIAGSTVPVYARPRLTNVLHMVAIKATNVWPSTRQGRCTG